MQHNYGKNSLSQISTCHMDLSKILMLAITRSTVDFGVSEGHRKPERQKMLFDRGLSQIDGIKRKGKHNYLPSLAADIYIFHPDKDTRRKLAYDKAHLCYVAGVITSCAKELLDRGEITHALRWGGNWDSDGIIIADQNFIDLPHFELVKA